MTLFVKVLQKLLGRYINTNKKHTMLLCNCFVMFPTHKLVGGTFFSPVHCAMFQEIRIVRWCIHSSHCACAPESCVYFPCCCTCKLCFVWWSWEQLPEVLSKLPVWEVRGYLQTPPLSTHTGPCSCFLWRLWTWNTHTRTHVLGFQEGHRKRKKATGRTVKFPLGFLSCW